MGKVIVYCDGGLGNRLNCYCNGVYLARALNADFQVWWPINRYCSIGFADIFESCVPIFNLNKRDILELDDYSLLGLDNFAGDGINNFINPELFFTEAGLLSAVSDALASSTYLVIFSPRILSQLDEKIFLEYKRFSFRDEIDVAHEQEKNSLGLSGPYWGLHMRGGDARYSSHYYLFWRKIASLLPGKVFLCTDDEELLGFFGKEKNIVTRKQIVLPEKIDSSAGWDSRTPDENGQILPYNVLRTKASVIDAVVDLLILSNSRILYTSQSTFLGSAICLSRDRSRFVGGITKYLDRTRAFLRTVRNIFQIGRHG